MRNWGTSFSREQSGRGVKLSIFLRLVSRLIMFGAMPTLPPTPSWRAQGELNFVLNFDRTRKFITAFTTARHYSLY
jgi:hypothetical protein